MCCWRLASCSFHIPLRMNAFGVLFLMIAFIMLRTRVAAYALRQELAEPPADHPVGAAARAGELA